MRMRGSLAGLPFSCHAFEMLRLRLVPGVLLAAMVTAAAPAPLIGVWSGDRATLTLTPTGGRFVEDCAEATIEGAVRSDDRGRFSVKGHREVFSGGPQRTDVPPVIRETDFVGEITPAGLLLEVRSGGNVETYRLLAGRRVKPIRCL